MSFDNPSTNVKRHLQLERHSSPLVRAAKQEPFSWFLSQVLSFRRGVAQREATSCPAPPATADTRLSLPPRLTVDRAEPVKGEKLLAQARDNSSWFLSIHRLWHHGRFAC
jgi:hypothetical protein